MPADLTPKQAREASDEQLTEWANLYRVGSGAHAVALAEILARAHSRKLLRNFAYAFAIAILAILVWLIKS